MVSTLSLETELTIDTPIDTWTSATWNQFLASSEDSESSKVRCYYDSGLMRIETMPTGSAHGQDNAMLAAIITLYGIVNNLSYVAFVNTSFRKSGERECQPDLAYYIDSNVQRPTKNNQAVDVGVWNAPTLAIEIASTSLSDDIGNKRLLYERLGVGEYWVVDVVAATMIAFEVANGGSRQIQVSQVLPGLAMNVVEEALRRSQTENDGTVNQWLLREFQALNTIE